MPTAADIERWLMRWLAKIPGSPEDIADPTSTFADHGLESADVVRLAGALAEWLGIPIEITAAYDWPTPRALAHALAEPDLSATDYAEDAVPAAWAERDGPQRQDHMDDLVAVVGLACRMPGGGDTPEDFWRLLLDGTDAVTTVPPERWDAEAYYNPDRSVSGGSYTRHGAFLRDITGWDAEFFGQPPREALRTDPQQRLLTEVVWEALEDAGIAPPDLSGSRTGVMLGLIDSGQYARLQLERHGPGCVADPYFAMGCSSSVAAGRISHHLNLRGPALTVDTACSSSLVAVHLAAQSLIRGECELAVAAGASALIHPDTFVWACAMSMLAADGRCKTFDERADGFVMGEGGGAIVLERLSDALRHGHRVRAILRGSAVNQDGHSNGLTAPNRAAQVEVIGQALAAAGVMPDEVDYVEAHGSGTRLGDAIELAALREVFGARPADRPLWIGAVKTNIGHLLAAAGIAGFIKTVLAVEHGELPPNLHLDRPNPALAAGGSVRPLTVRSGFPAQGGPRLAGVSAFGWSGTNAHIVLQQAPPLPPAPASEPAGQVLTLSAAAPRALAEQAGRLAHRLGTAPYLDLSDVAHTLQTGRAALAFRRALVCRDRADAIRRLTDPDVVAELARAPRRGPDHPRLVFLLPGADGQYAGMGRQLYATEPVFAQTVNTCVALLAETSGVDLRPAFSPPDGVVGAGAVAGLAEVTHPLVFTVEFALARLLARWGVEPDAMIGYGLGEYTAACLAGVFTLKDALRVVVERARLIDAHRAEETRAEEMRAKGIPVAARDRLREVIAALPRTAPIVPVVSSVTGAWLTDEQAVDPGYWADHLRGPARFTDGARPLGEEFDLYLEVGPGATLGALVRHNADHDINHDAAGNSGRSASSGRCRPSAADVLVTLPSPRDLGATGKDEISVERETVLHALGRLWERGVRVDWSATHHTPRSIVSLPTYPFQRTRFWPDGPAEPTPVSAPIRAERAAAPGANAAPVAPVDRCYVPSWQRDGDQVPSSGTLPGPLVVFADPGGVGSRLAELALEAGTTVLEVRPGSEYRHKGHRVTIDPAEADHYRAVMDVIGGLAPHGPLHVVHTWSMLAPPLFEAPARARGVFGPEGFFRRVIRDGFDSLLLLVQAMGDGLTQRAVRLLTVTAGSADVLGGDALAPERSVVHGLGRTLPAEYGTLRWQGVDLELPAPGEDCAQAAGQLLRELLGSGWDDDPAPPGRFAAWRRDRRWIQGWRPASVGATPDAHYAGWRADGVYLITGGTRGLGMALAKHLARAGVRRLALVGRTALPARAEWDTLLNGRAPIGRGPSGRGVSGPGADEWISGTLRDVRELEALGAEVMLLTADAGAAQELRQALRRAREHFGALHGVVHAAGVPGEGMAQHKTRRRAGAVLAPKVLGMAPLLELVDPRTAADERVELLVLYSSSVTVLGGLGEGDYCAANTVLDSCAAALAAAGTARVVSVAWGVWQHDDWQSTVLTGTPRLADLTRRYREEYGFTDEAGTALLDRILATRHPNILALRQPLADAARAWTVFSDVQTLVGPVAGQSAAAYPRPDLVTPYLAPQTGTEETIARLWGEGLGLERVGVADNFFELGGNSLIGVHIIDRVRRAFDLDELPPHTLYAAPTVEALATLINSGTHTGTGDVTGNGDVRTRGELRRTGLRGTALRRGRSGS